MTILDLYRKQVRYLYQRHAELLAQLRDLRGRAVVALVAAGADWDGHCATTPGLRDARCGGDDRG